MIKVSEPLLTGNEKKYLCQAIDEGEVSSSGKFVNRFEEAFAKWSGNRYAVAVCNGTAALETGIYSLNLDKTIPFAVPNNTIISCLLAAWRVGINPVLYEIPDDPFQEILGENILRCHLFGRFTEVIATNKIVDDCSQYWKPFPVKDVACYSLYANKLITCGEGGVIVTNEKETYERALHYRNLCHTEERFVHDDAGYNFRMSNLQAAVALAQLEQIDDFIEKKRTISHWYHKHLPDGVTTLWGEDVPWMFLVKTEKDAGEMVKNLLALGIECRRHFFPIHRQPFLESYAANGGYPYEIFPRSNEAWDFSFYLPSGLNLTQEDVEYVCQAVRSVLRAL